MNKTITVGTLQAKAGEKVQGFLSVEGTPVEIPITLINGTQEGKLVAITGGTHGGEYPGVEAAIRLAKNIQPDQVSGGLIIAHPVNVPAFLAKLQYNNPYDMKNLNREFPGEAGGTVTQRIAHAITTQLFTQADFYMDLHGGDIHEGLTPFVIYSKLGDQAQVQQSVDASIALGVKYVCGSVSTNGTFGCAATMGVPGFLGEIGNLGVWSEDEVERYYNGSMNVLRLQKVLAGEVVTNQDVVMVDHLEGGVSQQDGCWYPAISLEQTVKKGDKMGEVRDFFGNVLSEYHAQVDGIVLFVVGSLAICKDDPIYCLAVPE